MTSRRPHTHHGSPAPRKTSPDRPSTSIIGGSSHFHTSKVNSIANYSTVGSSFSAVRSSSAAERALRSMSSSSSIDSTVSLKRLRPMTSQIYQSNLILPATISSPQQQKQSLLSRREDRLWKPTNGHLPPPKQKTKHRFPMIQSQKKLLKSNNNNNKSTIDRSWITSFSLERSLYQSPAVWGTTKLAEVLQLCGVEDEDEDEDEDDKVTNTTTTTTTTKSLPPPNHMRSVVCIEILRQLREQLGMGSSTANMSLYRMLAAALLPSVSPLERITNTLTTPTSISTRCTTCNGKEEKYIFCYYFV